MSGAAVFQEALRALVRQSLPEPTQRDLLAALQAGRPGPLDFLYEAGAEGGLPTTSIVARSVPVFFNYCAGNLSDDLSDGECDYLSDPYRIGPCTQLSLQNLFFHALAHLEFPHTVMSSLASELITAVGQQHIELRTERWTAPIYRAVAEGVAGRQWSVYLQLLWFGTGWAGYAAEIGMNVGTTVHVARDIQTLDRRYTTLSELDKIRVIEWAARSANMLHSYRLNCVEALLRSVEPVLREAKG